MTAAALAALYDNFAKQRWDALDQALKQSDCREMYSITRNCDDCRNAYRDWVCAVTIPRCADPAATAAAVEKQRQAAENARRQAEMAKAAERGPPPTERSVVDLVTAGFSRAPAALLGIVLAQANSSALKSLVPAKLPPDFTVQNIAARTPQTAIRGFVVPRPASPFPSSSSSPTTASAPGPVSAAADYVEVLPCVDLCYAVIQSCPAYFGFRCPLERYARVTQYGIKELVFPGDPARSLTPLAGVRCNGMGHPEYEVLQVVGAASARALPRAGPLALAATAVIAAAGARTLADGV
ncbi:MAG: stretch-activated Ca2+-permeable channel component-domain-containing protein [Olpidium bornovanus]|uniref:Stretch-activated Ca2+-permeable channel component-domain-containing protein n=1 Tax=Olpidium bornovanus TaxID=278681 RepID=A0A8H8DMG2_9FUNG|nr:MAG: stretch-activated Ca2+-permeable channel component-domain-containing protein [Olpidium bornovanus]